MYVWHLSHGGPVGNTGWEACENIPHVLTVASPPVSLSLRLSRSINVSEPSLIRSPQKPCFSLSLLWARYRGLTQGSETLKRQKEKTSGWMFGGDGLIPQGADSRREITQSVVSMWKSLHFIFLIEPPAAPTSRAGPAYQDLKGRQQRPLKTTTVRTGQSGSKPKCLRPKGGKGRIYFHVPVSLSLSPVLHNPTGN